MSTAKVKFGTSGWRAIMCDEFTFRNVAVVTQAIADPSRRPTESVWDYPRPPRVERSERHVRVIVDGIHLAPEAVRLAVNAAGPRFVLMTDAGLAAILFYLGVYTLMNLGAFFYVVAINNHLKSEDLATSSGVLKQELGLLGCRLLELARRAAQRGPGRHFAPGAGGLKDYCVSLIGAGFFHLVLCLFIRLVFAQLFYCS